MNFLDSNFLLTTAAFVGALLVGAVVLSFLRRWRETTKQGASTANEQLAQFRALYERGELSDTEFRRLRDLLSGQIRKESGLPDDKPPPETGVKAPESN